MLRTEVVCWAADVAGALPGEHPARQRVRSALAGGLSMTGRLDEASRIGDEVLAAGGEELDRLFAAEGAADAAVYGRPAGRGPRPMA